jgi:hypothetical protein
MFNTKNIIRYIQYMKSKQQQNLKNKIGPKISKWWMAINYIKQNARMWSLNPWTQFELWYGENKNWWSNAYRAIFLNTNNGVIQGNLEIDNELK